MGIENRCVKPNTKWTPEIMAGGVLAIKHFGKPVTAIYLKTNHERLHAAMQRYPGGWRGIVELAGLNADEEKGVNLRRNGRAEPYDTSY